MRQVLSDLQKRIEKIVAAGVGEPRLLSADFQNQFGEDFIAEFAVSADRLDIAATARRSTPNDIPRAVWIPVLALANNVWGGRLILSLAGDLTLAATMKLSAEVFLQLGFDPEKKSLPLLTLQQALDETLSLAEKEAARVQSFFCDA